MSAICECPICYTDIVPSETGRWETSCGHAYHLKCFVDWLQTGADTCPLCRKVAGEMERPTKKAPTADKRRGDTIAMDEWVSMAISQYNNGYIHNNIIPIAANAAQVPLSTEEQMGLPLADIELVATQTNVSLRDAVRALHAQHGDIVNAIMALQPPNSEDLYT